MDWITKQRECKKCQGLGYQQSKDKHEDGSTPKAWAAMCDCQPKTIYDMQEKANQEKLITPK